LINHKRLRYLTAVSYSSFFFYHLMAHGALLPDMLLKFI